MYIDDAAQDLHVTIFMPNCTVRLGDLLRVEGNAQTQGKQHSTKACIEIQAASCTPTATLLAPAVAHARHSAFMAAMPSHLRAM